MPTDREMIRRDEREDRRMHGDNTPIFGTLRRTRRGKAGGPRPTDPDYHEKMAKRLYVTGPAKAYSLGRTVNWYVFGFKLNGSPVVLGPEASEVAALELGTKLQDAETFELATRDLSRATREIKHTMIERGHSPDKVVVPYRHSILGRRKK